MLTIIIFALVLSFLVVIHELGHFLMARFFKMRVEEFGLGYPPKITALFKDKLGTEYTLNWLPFGGFVRLYGEDGEASVEDAQAKGAFFTKPAWQRLIVILAGAIVNFVFGLLVFAGIYAYFGVVPEYKWHAEVTGVVEGSPAEQGGLVVGDEIAYVQGERGKRRILTSSDLIQMVSRYAGQEVVLVMTDGAEKSVYVRSMDEIPEGQGATGIEINDREEQDVTGAASVVYGARSGLIEAGLFSRMLLLSLGDMAVDGFTRGEVPSEVSGPVGIVHTAQKEDILTDSLVSILNFAAIISINLAIVNVLPIPALDGGRAVLIIIEMITRRKVKPELEQKLNTIGFLVLVSMILLVTARDIRNVANDYNVDDWVRSGYEQTRNGEPNQLFTFGTLSLGLFMTGLMVYFSRRQKD